MVCFRLPIRPVLSRQSQTLLIGCSWCSRPEHSTVTSCFSPLPLIISRTLWWRSSTWALKRQVRWVCWRSTASSIWMRSCIIIRWSTEQMVMRPLWTRMWPFFRSPTITMKRWCEERHLKNISNSSRKTLVRPLRNWPPVGKLAWLPNRSKKKRQRPRRKRSDYRIPRIFRRRHRLQKFRKKGGKPLRKLFVRKSNRNSRSQKRLWYYLSWKTRWLFIKRKHSFLRIRILFSYDRLLKIRLLLRYLTPFLLLSLLSSNPRNLH